MEDVPFGPTIAILPLTSSSQDRAMEVTRTSGTTILGMAIVVMSLPIMVTQLTADLSVAGALSAAILSVQLNRRWLTWLASRYRRPPVGKHRPCLVSGVSSW